MAKKVVESMEKKMGISQEGLKIIACAVMLIDHVGAVLLPQFFVLRMIGRIAFPIFCFLLAEGAHYTKSPSKYALRLAIGAVLSELPFDLALFGGLTLDYQSVMVTMLLGFGALMTMRKVDRLYLKCLAILPFALVAELLRTDYGGGGILLIALFGLTRELPHRTLWQAVGMMVLCQFVMPGLVMIQVGAVGIGVEILAVLAMVPIARYTGEKHSHSAAVQWGFYLFYPVHLTVLYLLRIWAYL